MTELQKNIERSLSGTLIQGKGICIRVTKEGVYVKRQGERWTSAYLCPWDAAYSMGAKIKAREIKPEKPPTSVRRGLLGLG